jgi:hypothetical protein
MKYLDSSFNVVLGTKEYREGWERIFQKKEKFAPAWCGFPPNKEGRSEFSRGDVVTFLVNDENDKKVSFSDPLLAETFKSRIGTQALWVKQDWSVEDMKREIDSLLTENGWDLG